MKPISKFSNLGPSNLARRIATAMLVEESVKSDQDAPAATKMDHRQRWREATPELNRERQRGYQRCYRRRKREEASQP